MRRTAMIAATVLAAAAALTACSSSSSTSSSTSPGASAAPVTLTLWHNYGTEQNATATVNLVKAYEALHKNVTIKVVSQPAANYFAQLQAAAVSKTGPDIAVMWTGLFTLQNKSYLSDLKPLIPAASLSKVQGLQWGSAGLNAANATYVMPLEKQFYIGFYNKKDFAKAGVTSMPQNWNQLYAACTKLKAAGFTPMVYGNGGQGLGAEFYPWYDASYQMIGMYSVSQWLGLYSGSIPWNSAANIASYQKWADLKTKGCTNADVLTKTDNLTDFTSGKAAMMIDGTWDTQKFTDALGTNVASFIPPFTDTKMKGVVEYPGDGFSVMSYSKHQQAAADFLTFLTTPAAAQIINAAGLIPDLNGTTTTNPVNQQMLSYAETQGYTRYPMLDNVTQGNVVNTGNTTLPSILDGKISPTAGLGSMNTTWQQLPAAQRGSSYQ